MCRGSAPCRIPPDRYALRFLGGSFCKFRKKCSTKEHAPKIQVKALLSVRNGSWVREHQKVPGRGCWLAWRAFLSLLLFPGEPIADHPICTDDFAKPYVSLHSTLDINNLDDTYRIYSTECDTYCLNHHNIYYTISPKHHYVSATKHDKHTGVRIGEAANPGPSEIDNSMLTFQEKRKLFQSTPNAANIGAMHNNTCLHDTGQRSAWNDSDTKGNQLQGADIHLNTNLDSFRSAANNQYSVPTSQIHNQPAVNKQNGHNADWSAQGQHSAEDDQSTGASIMQIYQEQPEDFRAKRLRFSSTPLAVMEDDVYFKFCALPPPSHCLTTSRCLRRQLFPTSADKQQVA